MTATKKTKKLTLKELTSELSEVARIGETFVDGEQVKDAWMPYAQNFMKGDDMDYNEVPTVPLKKTLLRLEKVSRVPCSTLIWRRRPDVPSSGEVVLIGFMGSPEAGSKPANRGYVPPKMTKEIAAVFRTGKQVVKVSKKPPMTAKIMHTRGRGAPASGVKGYAMVQVYAPVKDSMGDICAVLEVFGTAVGSK